MKKKKDVRKKLNFQRVDRDIIEGDRIYRMMADAMLSADTTIGGTVAMNYALAKVIANYKLSMRELGVDVESYLKDMTNWWECKLKAEESDDQDRFDNFAMRVNEMTIKNFDF